MHHAGTGLAINALMVIGLEHSSGAQGRDHVIVADVHQTYSLKLAAFFESSSRGPTDNIITQMLDFLVVVSIFAYFVAVLLRLLNVGLAYGLRESHGRWPGSAGGVPADGESAAGTTASGGGAGGSKDESATAPGGSGGGGGGGNGGGGGGGSSGSGELAPMLLDRSRRKSDEENLKDVKRTLEKTWEKTLYAWTIAKKSVANTPASELSAVMLCVLRCGCGCCCCGGGCCGCCCCCCCCCRCSRTCTHACIHS